MRMRDNAKVDLLTLSSMGVRILPAGRQPVHTSRFFEMTCTSAESNVLNISASLGLQTKVLTRFVQGSPIAAFIKSELRRRGIAFEGPDIVPNGPWGVRHQINVADAGFGPRGPRVYNDRAGEVGRTITAEDFQLERVFLQDGCRVLHLSGLIAALSESTGAACLQLARMAKQNGCLISFDLNHRASFWEGRQQQLRAVFNQIALLADILIGNEEDYQLALGIDGPPAGGSGIAGKIDGFKEMIGRVAAKYPNAKVYATTLRQVESANLHQWGAILQANGEWFVELPRPIQVLDRIGGGDGFVGGLLYSILKGWQPEKWLQFAWASGALAATMVEDYATPADEAQLWGIYNGNARVLR